MRLTEAIDNLIAATIANGGSKATAQAYKSKLKQLVTYLNDKDVEKVTLTDLRSYVASLRSRTSRYASTDVRPEVEGGLSPATIASHIRAMKRLFKWLTEEGIIASDPSARIKTPTPPRGEPKAYTLEDFKMLMKATSGPDPVSIRNRAIIIFLVDTGCRVAGLVGMRIQDIDFTRQLVRITEKGNKTRLVPFDDPTREALESWLKVRPNVPTDKVWTTFQGDNLALDAEGVRVFLKRLAKKIGAKGPINPHSFRHGFARAYLLNGGDLASLADLLGHSSVEVTWRNYGIFRTTELQEKHRKHGPLSGMEWEGDKDE